LVEACVGLAIMTFVFLLAGFLVWMSGNKIRTAMAARHAAWLMGNGQAPTKDKIEEDFFYDEFVTVQPIEAIGALDALTGGDDRQNAYSGAGNGPFRYKVNFGIETNALDATTDYPFTWMKIQLPFMPKSELRHFVKVSSVCQWDEVGKTWTDWVDAIKWVWDEIVGGISSWF
jgi:hypothetical protein